MLKQEENHHSERNKHTSGTMTRTEMVMLEQDQLDHISMGVAMKFTFQPAIALPTTRVINDFAMPEMRLPKANMKIYPK